MYLKKPHKSTTWWQKQNLGGKEAFASETADMGSR